MVSIHIKLTRAAIFSHAAIMAVGMAMSVCLSVLQDGLP